MKKGIVFLAVLMALVALCFEFTGRNNGSSSGSDEPTPPLAVVYTVSFDSNGGSGTMVSLQVASGASYTVPANGFSAPNFIPPVVGVASDKKFFTGWNTDASGT